MIVEQTSQIGRRRQRLGVWLAGGSSLIYVCSRFLPCAPPSHHGEIEDSFIQFLHRAFVERLQFGRDIVFNFGPWGFLYGGYHPATHLTAVVMWLGLSLVFWWAGWRAARHFSKSELAAWVWLMAFAAVAGLPIFTLVDARLKAFVVLLWLLHFFVEDRLSAAAQAAVVMALGLLSLVKFNVLVEAALVVGIIALDDVFRRRRLPWLVALYGAAIVFFWAAAGQPLGGLGPFLRSSSQMVNGYSEAMIFTGPNPIQGPACFLVAAGLVGAVAGWAGWVRHRWLGVFALAGLGLMLFTAFKHGYVRHDFHEAAATLELLLAALAALAIAWPLARGQRRLLAVASLLPTVAAGVLAAATFSRYSEKGLAAQVVGTFSVRNLLAPARLLGGTGYLRAGYEAYLADLRKRQPAAGAGGRGGYVSRKRRRHPGARIDLPPAASACRA